MSAEASATVGEQVRRFWRWWTGELRACVPEFLVKMNSRAHVLPLVVHEQGGYSIHRFDGAAWRRSGSVSGDTPESIAKALGAELRRAGIKRFSLALLPGQYLSKIIHLPAAAEDNVRNALRYELDRHTPFKPEDVGFDCCIVGRNEDAREINVRLVIAPKATIGHAVEGVAGSGVLIGAIQPAFPDRDSLSINVLPHEESGSALIDRIGRWAPWILLAALALGALVLPVWQKRAQVIELQPQVNIAVQQAQAADQLHQQLEKAQNEYNFVLQRRYVAPTSLQLLNEVTRILPDDTWLQNFELRTTSKGKEVQLQGETGVAGKLIELFEVSPLLTGASFKSPVTQAPGSQGSRFHLGMDVKEAAPPAAQAAAPEASPIPPATAVAATPAASAASATAVTTAAPNTDSPAAAAAAVKSSGGATVPAVATASSKQTGPVNVPAAAPTSKQAVPVNVPAAAPASKQAVPVNGPTVAAPSRQSASVDGPAAAPAKPADPAAAPATPAAAAAPSSASVPVSKK